MSRAASLGMYDGPALSGANDNLWSAIAERLVERGVEGVPTSLDRQRTLDEIWGDPGLLFAQCCGYPLATRYSGGLRYLATPRYAAAGCLGTSYRSRIIVGADAPVHRLAEMRGTRAVVNQWQSHSGMNLFRGAVAPLANGRRFFASVRETGSHAASLRAVADGTADIAAIDAVSFAHLSRSDPSLAGRTRTLGWTGHSPGLPFVTSIHTPECIVRALRGALRDVGTSREASAARKTLLIEGIERLPAGAYRRILRFEHRARLLRYPELA